jgi:DNA (cytosine-5)-methyltransferase 1
VIPKNVRPLRYPRRNSHHGGAAMRNEAQKLTVFEICAGGGGQALGLEAAGFIHASAVEIDEAACETLRQNRPAWHVIQKDVRRLSDSELKAGVDLLAGGVPCPPFSIAGKQLGAEDERDLFPAALQLVKRLEPKAVLLENVRGLASEKFRLYRESILRQLADAGYEPSWRLLNASAFGVSQLRPRFIVVALKKEYADRFQWPAGSREQRTVADTIGDLIAAGGWKGAKAWMAKARSIAPTIVGGSKKHGGPDLGPTRARAQWAELGVNGLGIAEEPPGPDFPVVGLPKLTLRMVARLQGFPDDWKLIGRKTAAYRQIGNAFPPPVAAAVGQAIRRAIEGEQDSTGSVESRQPIQLKLPRAMLR